MWLCRSCLSIGRGINAIMVYPPGSYGGINHDRRFMPRKPIDKQERQVSYRLLGPGGLFLFRPARLASAERFLLLFAKKQREAPPFAVCG